MSMECFCGCGITPRESLKAANSQGADLGRQIRRLELIGADLLNEDSTANLATLAHFIAEGHAYCFRLAGDMHNGTQPAEGLVGLIGDWRRREGLLYLDVPDAEVAMHKRITAAADAAGMTLDQASEAFVAKKFDMFRAVAPHPELAPLVDQMIEMAGELQSGARDA